MATVTEKKPEPARLKKATVFWVKESDREPLPADRLSEDRRVPGGASVPDGGRLDI